jgi:hypothetical protein
MAQDWDLFEDALQSAQRRRRELVARLRERLRAAGDKLSDEQVAAVVERMADLALGAGNLRHW